MRIHVVHSDLGVQVPLFPSQRHNVSGFRIVNGATKVEVIMQTSRTLIPYLQLNDFGYLRELNSKSISSPTIEDRRNMKKFKAFTDSLDTIYEATKPVVTSRLWSEFEQLESIDPEHI
jgi:hypothetical protein